MQVDHTSLRALWEVLLTEHGAWCGKNFPRSSHWRIFNMWLQGARKKLYLRKPIFANLCWKSFYIGYWGWILELIWKKNFLFITNTHKRYINNEITFEYVGFTGAVSSNLEKRKKKNNKGDWVLTGLKLPLKKTYRQRYALY